MHSMFVVLALLTPSRKSYLYSTTVLYYGAKFIALVSFVNVKYQFIKLERDVSFLRRSKMRSLSFLVTLALCCGVPQTHGLVVPNNNKRVTRQQRTAATVGYPVPTRTLSQRPPWNFVSTQLRSSKEDEIAKLEEQLRKLKEEAEQEEPSSASTMEEQQQQQEEEEPTQPVVASSDDFVGRGPAKRPVQPMEEMMSEAWKKSHTGSIESTQEEEGAGFGGSITSILGAIAFVVFLGFFSQVPVGQEELGKYQAIKSSTQIDLGDINPVRSGDF